MTDDTRPDDTGPDDTRTYDTRPDDTRTDEPRTDRAWTPLRALTAARIGLPRSGASLSTGALLAFRLAHARARDAVHHDLAVPDALGALGLPVVVVRSRAPDRRTYLMRPELGRALHDDPPLTPGRYDLAIVVADGLSALAAERHAAPVLAALLPALHAAGWTIAPLVVAHQARVALGDAVAGALGAGTVLVLIGERPGLSAPDSLGAYLTWTPGPATTDAERNCVSNIRPDGLGYADAARVLAHLLARMRALGISGVRLKDDSGSWLLPFPSDEDRGEGEPEPANAEPPAIPPPPPPA